MLLLTVEANGWSFQSINEQQCIQQMETIEPFMVKQALKIYSKSSTNDIYELDLDKVAIFRAQILFESSAVSIQCLPLPMNVTLTFLRTK